MEEDFDKMELLDNFVYKYQESLRVIGSTLAAYLHDYKGEDAEKIMLAYKDVVYCTISEIGTAIDSYWPYKQED